MLKKLFQKIHDLKDQKNQNYLKYVWAEASIDCRALGGHVGEWARHIGFSANRVKAFQEDNGLWNVYLTAEVLTKKPKFFFGSKMVKRDINAHCLARNLPTIGMISLMEEFNSDHFCLQRDRQHLMHFSAFKNFNIELGGQR